MSVILHIETSTNVCSCALSEENRIIANREDFKGQSHAALLGVFADEMMGEARRLQLPVDAVAVSSGPGSYTGLRIGVSEAKGLAYGLDVPLIAISTPLIMASTMQDRANKNTLLCPMIDARRMEVYATFFDLSLNVIKPTSADIIDETSYREWLDAHEILFFGNGAEKCKQAIRHPNARFIDGVHPLASAMAPLAESFFNEKKFVDTAYFEPFYLKEFVATVAKNKVF
ncbi:MAG: tRNA (adenosine(37)-N6)-threonylcarbamoyltransferase complex dimerization subunit type 1 TsaB [Dysgonamonadaceae bacterium]|jgi:tRNA threonylcarbamoyladenosine biosynthesis protein TsaB|nr:tRNA (adenosine(37)-N6)-threonylcarbamoyltransferase complex dimerization subunit type 1 TsaB [Dysgonamonadaceae bacterium]